MHGTGHHAAADAVCPPAGAVGAAARLLIRRRAIAAPRRRHAAAILKFATALRRNGHKLRFTGRKSCGKQSRPTKRNCGDVGLSRCPRATWRAGALSHPSRLHSATSLPFNSVTLRTHGHKREAIFSRGRRAMSCGCLPVGGCKMPWRKA